MLVRLFAAALLLLQPLPAQGLSDWLPCPQSCAHCDGDADAAGAATDSGRAPCCGGADAAPAPDCPCVHEAPPDQPVEPSAAPRAPGAPLEWTLAPAGTLQLSSARGGGQRPAWRAQDPPHGGRVLCVWRK